MIKQTIYARVSSLIPAITRSYRFNGGTATVQLDSLGNYEVLVNGSRFSSLENSAKRDPGYKASVGDVSTKMMVAFEKCDADFTSMQKKSPRMQKLSEHQKKIDDMSPERYERETFPLSRPGREDIRKELEQEAEIRFADLYEDKRKERTSFVNEQEKTALAARMRAYEEVQAFFDDLQDNKEAKANALFQKEYERKKKEIEDFIYGETSKTETNLRMILGELNLPFRVEITCDYNQSLGLLETKIELPMDLGVPTSKTNILASGKISVKDKLVKEVEQSKTETILSLVYYVAASLFNATINIQTQRVSVVTAGGNGGILWVQFDRKKFSRLSMRTVIPLQNYYDWPRVDALRVVRGASQFDTMDIAGFNLAIQQIIAENGIEVPTLEENETVVSEVGWTTTIGDAQTLASALTEDYELQAIVSDAINAKIYKVTLPKKYKGIFKELKG